MKWVDFMLKKEETELIVNHLENADVSIGRVLVYGSYINNPETANDIDILVEYHGGYSEDHLFNILNDESLHINELKVDFNPINLSMRGIMPYYNPQYGEMIPLHYSEVYIEKDCFYKRID